MGAIPLLLLLGAEEDGILAHQPGFTSERQALDIQSTVDGSSQRSYLVVPPNQPSGPHPLLVMLHSWGSNNEGRSPTIEAQAATRGWFVLAPNFRGPSNHPEACGSPVAQQDILDAVAFVRGKFPIDDKRIYLMGYSGGGFMTLLMAARYPGTWAAASSWARMPDLAAWYGEAAENTRRSLGGCFGDGPKDDHLKGRYRERSPIAYLRPTLEVPIAIGHGDHDPQVSVSHALRAFDLLAPGSVSASERDDIASGKAAATTNRDPLDRRGHPVATSGWIVPAHDPRRGARLFCSRGNGVARGAPPAIEHGQSDETGDERTIHFALSLRRMVCPLDSSRLVFPDSAR